MKHDESLIKDEFHQAARRIISRSAEGALRPKGIFDPPKPKEPVYQRLNPTLAHNATSGRIKLHQEKKCRICPNRRNLTRHHLIPQVWFKYRKEELRSLRNANANIVPLCEECHRIIDSAIDPVGKLQKRAALRDALYSNEIAFILQVRGPQWFNLAYPTNP